jgi:thiosulfate/3-mercaptopyruvate sulfurtransferase
MPMDHILTEALQQQLNDPHLRLIDVRSVDAYNGWPLRGENRGGHIRNARSLPHKWLQYIDWIEIVHSKGISRENQVVLYGYDEDDAQDVGRQFVQCGYPRVSLYNNFVSDWCSDALLPMERLQRYRYLVSAQWVHSLITTGTAPEYANSRYVLCHAHYRHRGAYDQGHIPGAIELDTNTLESSETWNRRSPAELKTAFERMGITWDTTVIVYGRFSNPNIHDPFPGSSAGQLAAMRCAFIMLYAGIADVRVLNGGLQSWLDAGFETVTEETRKTPVSDFGRAIPARPELAVDTPEAKSILAAPGQNLVSVRSRDEYVGKVSGYNYIDKKGRIPGSVFADCGSDAYHMENYRKLDHTTREFHEIEQMWAQSGITRDTYNAFYCGTGWRGSEAFMNAWLMGWPRISVYDGGWFEWSADATNPIETGVPCRSEIVAGVQR